MKTKNVVSWGLCLLAVLCSGTGELNAQSLSNTSASFVDIGYGVRPSGLGFAYTGLAEGPDAVMWNPAGLGQSENLDFSAMHTSQYGIVNYDYVGAAVPVLGETHKLGFALTTSGDDALREHSFHAAYAYTLDKLYLGGAVKLRMNSFGNNSLNEGDYVVFDQDEISDGFARQIHGTGFGVGIDFGALYKVKEHMQFGVMVRDAYAPFWWESSTRGDTDEQAKGSYEEGLPLEVAVGGSYKYGESFVITTDYLPKIYEEGADALRAGIEKTFLDLISLRAGTEQRFRTDEIDHYTLGFGLQSPPVSGVSLAAHYSFVINDLTNTHRLGLQIQIH